ncbi:MAG: HEPN domain-containing protein [Candidatus Altiarchaeota archaeon]|nr:HEPN domain-containing protein [Candidatus Altiarchaeota archaeon]
MNTEDLERKGMIQKLPANKQQIENSLTLAKRDLETAKKTYENSIDWAFTIAYNSILQAARALMFSKGYRPTGEKQHLAVIKFTETTLGDKYRKEITAFDRLRRKRHATIYDQAGTISEYEAKHAIKTAEKFLKTIEEEIKKQR